jgi:DNA-binding GntR family transcriptional regulator
MREAVAQLTTEGLIDLAPNRVRRVSVITRKNALDLLDVMGVLACALQRGDTTVAGVAGADVSTS